MSRGVVAVVLLSAAVVGVLATAAVADVLPGAILGCADQPDAKLRLACFDAAVAEMRKPTGASGVGTTTEGAPAAPVARSGTTAPAAAAATAAAPPPANVALSPEDQYGRRAPKEKRIEGLSATATTVSTRPRGELVITLDNGQVWAEIAPGSKVKVKAGDSVRIESGTLGSYILVAPNGRSSKVSRVR
jgi:hypothetical protein